MVHTDLSIVRFDVFAFILYYKFTDGPDFQKLKHYFPFLWTPGAVHHRGGQRRRLDEGEEAERRGGLRSHLVCGNHYGEKQQRCRHLHLSPLVRPPSPRRSLHSLLSLSSSRDNTGKGKTPRRISARTSIRLFPPLLSVPSLLSPINRVSVSPHPHPPCVSVGLCSPAVSVWAKGQMGQHLSECILCVKDVSTAVLSPMSSLHHLLSIKVFQIVLCNISATVYFFVFIRLSRSFNCLWFIF